MSLARMIQKPMVKNKRELWVTRRKIVDVLTPNLLNFGLRKESMGPDEDRDWGADWSPLSLAIGDGPGWETAVCGSLSAGWRVGTDERWAVEADSGSGAEGNGLVRLSLKPISPLLVGNGSACGRVSVCSWKTMGDEGEREDMTSRRRVRRVACTWQVWQDGMRSLASVNWGSG